MPGKPLVNVAARYCGLLTLRNMALSLQGGTTTVTGSSYCLPVDMIGNITGREQSLNICTRAPGLLDNIAILIDIDQPLEKS